MLPLLLVAAGPLAAQQQVGCAYSFDPGPYFLPGSAAQRVAGAVNVVVTTPTGYTCSWSVTATAQWIHVTSLTITGSGSIPYTLDNNNSAVMRNDVLTLTASGTNTESYNPLQLPIYQLAANCASTAFTLSPPSVEIPVGGSTNGVLQITTGCAWSVSSNQGWLGFTLDSGNLVSSANLPVIYHPGATNYGNGKVDYTVGANSCATGRSASLTLNTGATGIPPALAVTQDGSPNNLALSPATLTISSSAVTGGRVTVNTGLGCPWNAVSNANWLQISGATSGNGFGSFLYNVLANTGPARTGSIQVGPQTFTLTQQATLPPAPQLTLVENGASEASGVVSPGEIVTLWGSNLGPAPGVAFQLSAGGKSIPNTLAGVQVFFDGTSATLLYVSAAQVNAIVPYRMAGPSTAVQVQYQNQTSNTLTVPVQGATPGIFSQDATGLGPGAILNQDYSLNASLSPATIGSVIQIFATGGGVTSPAQTDGALAPLAEPFPRIVALPVSVTIGGLPAKVDYAGAAPGLVAGLTQIDAEVPAGVTPGLSVPVVVQIGTWQSQAGLTITVK
ncbi:MAG TPA: BACON domain-containing carbohydrate-binding protein [Bryobacteraceae bacterium]|nr:BACON domain-containing carbohydrate-binding protein [Bryobacteraceae bacterium]